MCYENAALSHSYKTQRVTSFDNSWACNKCLPC